MIRNLVALLSLSAAAVVSAQTIPPVRYLDGTPACPLDLDIRNIDTRLSALVVPADNQRALVQERAKAVQCRFNGGQYSEGDWKRLRAVLRGES